MKLLSVIPVRSYTKISYLRTVYKRLLTILLSLLCLPGIVSSAADIAGGIFNSPKGFGVSADIKASQNVVSISLFADMYGVFSRKSDIPGIKAEIFFNREILSRKLKYSTMALYAGPGASLGYLRDFRKDSPSAMGMEVSVCTDTGIEFIFREKVILDLSLALDLGLFITSKADDGESPVRFYRNGGLQFIYPQLKIMFPF